MFRRLHFLLPNANLAQGVVNELLSLGINSKYIHTYAEHNLPLDSLQPATHNQASDKAQHIENFFWNGNLIVFAIFLLVFIASLITATYQLALISIGIMLITFAIGNFFTHYIPHTHLSNFKDAISHNELLMMVDVPDEKVAEIEESIHRHHPAAVEGGTSWTVKGADI